MAYLTPQNTMGELEHIPELGDMARFVMYTKDTENQAAQGFTDMPIAGAKNIGWSPEGMCAGVNLLIDQVVNKGAKAHYVYTEAECAGDAQMKNVNVIRLVPETIDPEKPFVILVSGGAYNVVCNATEALPTAVHMIARGYQVFVLSYRVGEIGIFPKPIDDMAAALRYIRAHAEEFQLNPDVYVVAGFSAGANLISTWGTTNAGYASYDLPKPKAMFPIYTVVDLKTLDDTTPNCEFLNTMLGVDYTKDMVAKYNIEQHIDADYPPCYIVCGKDDTTVSPKNSELMKQRLDEAGVPAILCEGEHAQHGFGDGTGTDVEGWPECALDFMEAL